MKTFHIEINVVLLQLVFCCLTFNSWTYQVKYNVFLGIKMNCFSVENGDIPATALIKSANYAGSVANAKTLCCIAYGVSRCMIPCFQENITLKHVYCNLPLCRATTPCFFGNQNSFCLLAHYNSLHSAHVLQAITR